MPLPRLIPCLDVAGGRVVKGVRFRELRDVGDPVELGAAYSDGGADELVFLDISASLDDKTAVVREYWKVVLNSNLLCELYHDVASNDWFVERVYD